MQSLDKKHIKDKDSAETFKNDREQSGNNSAGLKKHTKSFDTESLSIIRKDSDYSDLSHKDLDMVNLDKAQSRVKFMEDSRDRDRNERKREREQQRERDRHDIEQRERERDRAE